MLEEHVLARLQPTHILAHYRALVWPIVERHLQDPPYPGAFQVPDTYRSEQGLHWRAVSEYPSRQGKYLRAALLVLSCAAMGGEEQQALTTAAAMQLAEEWMLVHDDLEDGSTLRRGKPALHCLYGSGLAVNAGDTLHALMWGLLLENKEVLGLQRAYLVLEEFYRIILRTTLGQSVELQWTAANATTLSDEDWFFLSDGKAGFYTIGAPLRLGALIAGAGATELEALSGFGVPLGRCFQLVDDLLDLSGGFRGLKGQRGSDIYEGKRTVMLAHLLRSICGPDRTRLLSIMAKCREEKTEEEVDWIIDQMQRHGSIAHARGLARACQAEAEAMFGYDLAFLSRQPARDRLEALIQYVLERDH
jgi:geranylgeranyl diphosphate synthase type II